MENGAVPKIILILGANPKDTSRLRLDEEMRNIEEALRRSGAEGKFVLYQKLAVRASDLQNALIRYNPNIVHFCGHGEEDGGLVLENEAGKAQLVETQALADLFELCADQIECVVLNACYSERQADAICQHIDYVIGMRKAVNDKAAIKFAEGFYGGLIAGKSVEMSYRLGCNAIQLEGLSGYNIPVLRKQASPFYVSRPALESLCYETLMKKGALVRLKAPQEMGKTSFALQILGQLSQAGLRTVHLNLKELGESGDFGELSQFLKCFCVEVCQKLGIANHLDQYWNEKFSTSKVNCTTFFEQYLLAQTNSPLVLCLDDVDTIFPFTHIASNFLGLLRVWHEKASIRKIWQRLRLVVIHSTEVYVPLNINESPFNVGLQIELTELNQTQVQKMAQSYGLELDAKDLQLLVDWVGGHPKLVREAFITFRKYPDRTLKQLLDEATTAGGIYFNHLDRLLKLVQQNETLLNALKSVLGSSGSVRLKTNYRHQLLSMGIVIPKGDEVVLRCRLYQQYFSKWFEVGE